MQPSQMQYWIKPDEINEISRCPPINEFSHKTERRRKSDYLENEYNIVSTPDKNVRKFYLSP